MNTNFKKIVMAALFAALACVMAFSRTYTTAYALNKTKVCEHDLFVALFGAIQSCRAHSKTLDSGGNSV